METSYWVKEDIRNGEGWAGLLDYFKYIVLSATLELAKGDLDKTACLLKIDRPMLASWIEEYPELVKK